MQKTESFEIRYVLENYVPNEAEATFACFEWIVSQKFDYTSRGKVVVTLDSERSGCQSEQKIQIGQQFASTWALIFCAAISLVLNIKYVNAIIKLYDTLRTQFVENFERRSVSINQANFDPEKMNRERLAFEDLNKQNEFYLA